MKPRNKLEAVLFAVPHGGHSMQDIVAIVAAVQWIAEHECPEGFGTYWHEKCQKLVKED